jgi:hypothetical protein
MTKMVERAEDAVRAYRGWEPGTDVVTALKESHALSDDSNALQDLLTDLYHLAEAAGVILNDYAAHKNYLAEAHRCMGCGMNQQQIEAEAAESVRLGEVNALPADECAGVWDRLGQAGPHEFDDIQEGEDEEAVQELAAKLAELPTAERIGFFAVAIDGGPYHGMFRAVCPQHGSQSKQDEYWVGSTPTEAIQNAERNHKHD